MASTVKDFLDLIKEIRGTVFTNNGTPTTGLWADIKDWHTSVSASKTAVDVGVASAVISVTTATTQASNASISAATATTQAGIAVTQASNASISAASALASYDSFDDRYLGAKSTAPTLDNDGAALLVGALYWDTPLSSLRIWNSFTWVTFSTPSAATVSNTPAGNISATTVQAALNELDVEKALLAGVTTQTFSVAPANTDGHAVGLGQLKERRGWNDIVNGDFNIAQIGTTFGANAGTVAVTNASAAVTGTGTNWLTTVKPNMVFQVAGVYYTVSTVTSDTALTLTIVYAGGTAAGLAYTIGPATSTYDLDGWLTNRVSVATCTVAQSLSSAIGGTAGKYARQVTVTALDNAVAVGDFYNDMVRIEGSNIVKYVGNTFTVGFRARYPVAGIHCVALRNIDNTLAYVVEINVAAINTWAAYSFTVVGGLPTTGTWNYTTGVGLSLSFVHLAGTDIHTTAGTWNAVTLNKQATANQVNDVISTTGSPYWAHEDVTVSLGNFVIPSSVSYEEELVRCMRYFERLTAVQGRLYITIATAFNTTTLYGILEFVQKRAIPIFAVSGNWRTLGMTGGASVTIALSDASIRQGFVTGTGTGYTALGAALIQSDDTATGIIDISARL